MRAFLKILIITISMSIIIYCLDKPIKANTITPDRENYLAHTIFGDNGEDIEEIKFQISFKLDIFEISKIKLSTSYTQKSYWGLYDEANSRPFRETNYNPQIYFNYSDNKQCSYKLGYWHESNGQKDNYDKYGVLSSDSRSWDRYYAERECIIDKLKMRITIWDVFESEHPDIENFSGGGQIYLRYNIKGFHVSIEKSKAHNEITFKLPNLISESSHLSISMRNGYIDSLKDWDKNLTRYMVKVNFGGE